MRHSRTEPSLDDLLGDDITRQLMVRDGVAVEALRRLLSRVKAARADISAARAAAPADCACCG
jgi:hypothetical protein